jgi:hypothetical protein
MTALSRRALLESALLLVGAAGVAPELAFAQTKGKSARFLSKAHYATLDEVSALIIPKTDTPGAREVGVPRNIDALLANWANAATRAEFTGLLDAIDKDSRAKLGGALSAAPMAKRLDYLRAYDAAALARWDRPYVRLKELILTLYYLSEPGATEELRYEHSPGAWEAWTPAGPGTRAWAV